MAGLTSAMGMAAQIATAAPVTFGKSAVGDSAVLAAAGDKALSLVPLNLQDNMPLTGPSRPMWLSTKPTKMAFSLTV